MRGPKVVVAGAMANKPGNGGEAWVRMTWIRGLQRLGCQVSFVEQIAASHCTDLAGRPAPFAESFNASWFSQMTACLGLDGRAALLCDTGESAGTSFSEILDVASDADLLVNISGHLTHAGLRTAFRRQAFVDIDPGFTQFWHAEGNRGARLEGHDRYFTIGANIGSPDCPIPTGGIAWQPTRQPVVLDDWRCDGERPSPERPPSFTTVATWRGPFGPVERDQRRFGLKVHEFRKFISLPERVPARFRVALAIHPAELADIDLLQAHRWELEDPRTAAGTPDAFRSFVARSTAEFSVAQGIYVETKSGWFSDRTTRYLASGRPALVQDTGFTRHLPADKGLVVFTTLDQAVAGARSIMADYDVHAAAARAIAESYFDSDVILARFLDDCDVA